MQVPNLKQDRHCGGMPYITALCYFEPHIRALMTIRFRPQQSLRSTVKCRSPTLSHCFNSKKAPISTTRKQKKNHVTLFDSSHTIFFYPKKKEKNQQPLPSRYVYVLCILLKSLSRMYVYQLSRLSRSILQRKR